MNFQGLTKVETPTFYLDVAFKRGKTRADIARQKTGKRDPLRKSKEIEQARIEAVKDYLVGAFDAIVQKFPRYDQLPDFYKELMNITLDVGELRVSLSRVAWASEKTKEFWRRYKSIIQRTTEATMVNKPRKEFYGRIASVVNQLKHPCVVIDESRKIMKGYPHIKTEMRSVAIVGFPNVGKTTLLYKLTGSKPEIGAYAFTTKSINVAYLKQGDEKVQLIDTPGTLNRADRMNDIEKQAHLIMKLIAEKFVYVYDLTEPYPLKLQRDLYEYLKKFKKDILVYVSKADIIDASLIKKFSQEHKVISDPQILKNLI